jgi:type IX secretion system PorP/SprF family membrane protein
MAKMSKCPSLLAKLFYIFCLVFIFFSDASASVINKDTNLNFERIHNNFHSNPAFTGFSGLYQANFTYQKYIPQFNALEGQQINPVEKNFMIDVALGKRRTIGIGLGVNEYSIGLLRKAQQYLGVAYNHDFRKWGKLSLGASLTVYSHMKDLGKTTFGDMINPKLGFIYPTQEHFPSSGAFTLGPTLLINSGIYYSNKFFYLSYSALNLNKQMLSYYEDNKSVINRIDMYTAGGHIQLSKKLKVHPAFIYISREEGLFWNLKPSVTLSYKDKIYLGGRVTFVNSGLSDYGIFVNYHWLNMASFNFNCDFLSNIISDKTLVISNIGFSTNIYFKTLKFWK